MLISFKVANYRSFGEEQTLTFKAKTAPDAERLVLSPKRDCYKLQALYGPNAGGKTNWVRALAVFQLMVTDSSKDTTFEYGLPAEPFRLNSSGTAEPTSFEIEFIYQDCRYDYQMAFTREEIVKERLSAYPNGREQVWFVREAVENGSYDWCFGRYFKGDKRLLKQVTRKDALFLSTAVQFNCEPLRPVFEWIRHHLVILSGAQLSKETTLKWLSEHPERKGDVVNLVRQADPTIVDLDIRQRLLNLQVFLSYSVEAAAEESENSRRELYFRHASGAEMPWYQESTGTLGLFGLASLWLSAEREEVTLVVDDLDAHWHPLLFKRLLKKIAANRVQSQLLFTTHNTAYLSDAALLSHEQIWLVERDSETHQSRLFSLRNVRLQRAKETENIEAMYLDGCYGAIPLAERKK